MSNSEYLVSEFDFVGQLVDIIIKSDNQVKYLKLATDRREYWIKVSKQIRNSLSKILQVGCQVQIRGHRKQSWKKGKVKLKAYSVKLLSQPQQNPLPKVESKPKAKVLVCKKSTCWKKGGQTVCKLLEESLRDRGLANQVEIKTTGCLKQCKQGPNLVMMPDKTSYTRVTPQQVSTLVEKHLVK